ncbi:MAG: dephospho-CoA kinase [Deltaproteobacteria bacterium]|nr:dephospho-CoA kinase [Deltaproteobacteria bacterium]
MKRVGLTGGLATGKSTVGRYLVALGAHLLDADQLVHALYETDHALQQKILRRFGPRVATPQGTIDREALGNIVFANAIARHHLEQIVHPRVRTCIGEESARLEHDGASLILYDIPLLFESGFPWDFDAIVVAVCDDATQRHRVMARYHCTAAEAEQRIATQMALDQKKAAADFVVDTSGALSATQAQVAQVYTALLATA